MNQWIMRWASVPAVGMVLRVACVALMVAACGHRDKKQLILSEYRDHQRSDQQHKDRMKKKEREKREAEWEKQHFFTSGVVRLFAHDYQERKWRDSKPIDQCLSDPGKEDRL